MSFWDSFLNLDSMCLPWISYLLRFWSSFLTSHDGICEFKNKKFQFCCRILRLRKTKSHFWLFLALIFKYKKRLKFVNLDDFCFSFRACFGKLAYMLLETTFVLETHLHFFGGQFGPSKKNHLVHYLAPTSHFWNSTFFPPNVGHLLL